MISKGKRRFLVELVNMKIFADRYMPDGKIDIIGLCVRAQRLSGTNNRWRQWRQATVFPYRRPSPETEAKLKEITDNIMAEYVSNGKSVQG